MYNPSTPLRTGLSPVTGVFVATLGRGSSHFHSLYYYYYSKTFRIVS